jgi:hypothetical protein
MSKYKNKILKWLKDEFIYVDRDRSDEPIDNHVDAFAKISKYEDCLTEGIKMLDDLIEIARENDWLNDFMPTLRINLDDSRAVKKIKVLGIDDIVREMDKRVLPEIILGKKILMTGSWDSYIETYERSLHREFNEIFNRDFGSEYHIWYYLERYINVDGCRDRQRKIYIQYNENNAEVVRDVKRLKLKDKASVELVKRLREEEK